MESYVIDLGAPPITTPVHEGRMPALVGKLELVDNGFYNPDVDGPKRAKQLLVTFLVLEDGDDFARKLSWYTPTYFARDERNRLKMLARAADPDFDLERGYPDLAALTAAIVGKQVEIKVDHVDREKDGQLHTYAKVAAVRPLAEPVSRETLNAAIVEAAPGFDPDGDEIAF